MTTKKIITVTLNPDLTRTIVSHYIAEGYYNRAIEATRLEPTGAGINISRALSFLGCNTEAVVLLASDATGIAYRSLISEEDFEVTPLIVDGHTRSNTVILDTGKKIETQITEAGFEVTNREVQKIVNLLKETIREGDIMILADSLPGSAPEDAYARMCEAAHNEGATVVAAMSGDSLIKVLSTKPELVSINQVELEALFNYPVRAFGDIISCAKKFIDRGVDRVLVKLKDTENAVLISASGSWMVEMPQGQGTSSGVQDGLLAGYLTGRLMHKPISEALELGGATALYASNHIGHVYGSFREVEELIEKVNIKSIGNIPPDR